MTNKHLPNSEGDSYFLMCSRCKHQMKWMTWAQQIGNSCCPDCGTSISKFRQVYYDDYYNYINKHYEAFQKARSEG